MRVRFVRGPSARISAASPSYGGPLERSSQAPTTATRPTGPDEGWKKVEKGGWWGADPYVARSAYRDFEDTPTDQVHHKRVRVVSVGEPRA